MKVTVFGTLAFARRALKQTTDGRHPLRPRGALSTTVAAVMARPDSRAAPRL
ncbi:hypothetical protein HBN54_000997 [Hymenobacter sp. 1B]|uniref:Uncharacterized protein n=1 Tax=Hymenobacter artigasi TaxID=2719616 RepID=A0ABX1HEH2_9BACT|nr:hypothetical protein [Hymenobacter artigasi]